MSKDKPDVIPKADVITLISRYTRKFDSNRACAEAIGCTTAQLSRALNDKEPPCPAILKAIGVKRAYLYVNGKLPARFRDGSHDL